MVLIEVDGKSMEVPEGTSIKQALETLGFKITMFPSDPGLFMPCQTGGCWSRALDIDGGVGAPWWLKGDYIKEICFTAGCNFCCPKSETGGSPT